MRTLQTENIPNLPPGGELASKWVLHEPKCAFDFKYVRKTTVFVLFLSREAAREAHQIAWDKNGAYQVLNRTSCFQFGIIFKKGNGSLRKPVSDREVDSKSKPVSYCSWRKVMLFLKVTSSFHQSS